MSRFGPALRVRRRWKLRTRGQFLWTGPGGQSASAEGGPTSNRSRAASLVRSQAAFMIAAALATAGSSMTPAT
jgi:hypothetical protein